MTWISIVVVWLTLDPCCYGQRVGDLVRVSDRYIKQYYHDVPFKWVNDAEVLIASRQVLRNKLQKLRQTLQDRDLINNRPDNKFMGFMMSPYEVFLQGLAPGEEKGKSSTRWISDYCGTPFDAHCFFLIFFFVIFGRMVRTIRNWPFLTRYVHPPGYLNTLPQVHLADLQHSAVEKACRPISRWNLGFLARKFRITLSQPSSDLIQIYFRNEERKPKPNPWKTLKIMKPWFKQYMRKARRDESLMATAQKYGDRIGRSDRERAELRTAIFQQLKKGERETPLTQEQKYQRNIALINRDKLKAQVEENRYDSAKAAATREAISKKIITQGVKRLELIEEAERIGKPLNPESFESKRRWGLAKNVFREVKRRNRTRNPFLYED